MHKCNLCLLLYVNNASNPRIRYISVNWCHLQCCAYGSVFTHSWSQYFFDQMLHMYFTSWWETDAISGLFGGPKQDLPWCWALFVGSLKTCLINVKQLTNITTLRLKYHLNRNRRKKQHAALQTTYHKHVYTLTWKNWF